MLNDKSEYRFKQLARELKKRLSLKDRSDELSQAEIVHLLLKYSDLEGMEEIISSAVRLEHALKCQRGNSQTWSFKYGKILQELSKALKNSPYQALKASLERHTDFRKLFPGITDTRSVLEEGGRNFHTFPDKLQSVPELEAWRAAWEASPYSTDLRHFFPPALPGACFSGRLKKIEVRRDWIIEEGKASHGGGDLRGEGECCVLYYGLNKELIGAAAWKWWGADFIYGVNFRLFLTIPGGWFGTWFDSRANRSDPSCGPHVYREQNPKDRKFINDCLTELTELRPYRYNDEGVAVRDVCR